VSKKEGEAMGRAFACRMLACLGDDRYGTWVFMDSGGRLINELLGGSLIIITPDYVEVRRPGGVPNYKLDF
jgi:hypothetical protein